MHRRAETRTAFGAYIPTRHDGDRAGVPATRGVAMSDAAVLEQRGSGGVASTAVGEAEARAEAERRLDRAMERYVDGDPRAFDELYSGVSSRIYGYLLHLVRDRARADDLLQVTFMRLHASRGAWARGARVLPWLVTIARNAAFDDMRRHSKARVRLTTTGQVPDAPAPLEDSGPDADLVEALNGAVARLPPQYREALALTKQLDMSIRQAATVVGTTETAMKLRIHRAYERLRGELAPPQRRPDP